MLIGHPVLDGGRFRLPLRGEAFGLADDHPGRVASGVEGFKRALRGMLGTWRNHRHCHSKRPCVDPHGHGGTENAWSTPKRRFDLEQLLLSDVRPLAGINLECEI
jgi:hypothetical protein